MLTVHTPIPGSLSFTRSLSSCTYIYVYTRISIFFLAHSAKRSRYVASLHGEEEDDDEIGRTPTFLVSSFVDPINEEEMANSIDEAKTRPPRGPNEQEIIPLFYPMLGHETCLSPSSEASSDPTLQQPRHPPRFFFFFHHFIFHKKRERKVKSPGGKFLLLFSKVFLSFLLSSMIVEREGGVEKVEGNFVRSTREREREKMTPRIMNHYDDPPSREFSPVSSAPCRSGGEDAAAGERRLAKKKKDWSEHGRETRGGEVSK